MASSFNVFGSAVKKLGGNKPVWLGVVSPLPVGGSLASDYAVAGAFYPAGMPINISGKVITPFIGWVVKAVNTSTHVLTVYANGFKPEVGAVLSPVGATFATTGAAGVVSAVAVNASDAECIDITIATSALDGVTAGNCVSGSAASAAASSGAALAVKPNAYLYNDIYVGDVTEGISATGAAVIAHAEGILVDRTLAAGVKAAMASAVPNVIQVNG